MKPAARVIVRPVDLSADSKQFTRNFKLLKLREFQRVFKNARIKSQDRAFVVLALENDASFARLGMAVAKKHIASAVDRNRIKRLVRESFRHRKTELLNLDIVVIARHGVDKLKNDQVFASLDQHWDNVIKRRNQKT